MLPNKQTLNGLAHVGDKMPAIGDLLNFGFDSLNGLRVGSRTVSRDNLYCWVPSKPFGDDGRLTADRNVDRLAPFQIDDDRPVAVAAGDCPVVDSNDDRWLQRRWISSATKDSKDGVSADADPKMGSKATSCCATQRIANLAQSLGEAIRAALHPGRQLFYRLGKRPNSAACIAALETPNLN